VPSDDVGSLMRMAGVGSKILVRDLIVRDLIVRLESVVAGCVAGRIDVWLRLSCVTLNRVNPED
jgi:hypothetical protein